MDENKIIPDVETLGRIESLGRVATLIRQSYGEDNLDIGSNYYIARESLNKFYDGIKRLKLDAPIRQGMDDLVSYLNEKLDKRERGDFA